MQKIETQVTEKALLQQTFDVTAKRMVQQKFQRSRSTEEPGCVYRAEDGKVCAIGAHIPDNCYFSAMEGRRVMQLVNEGHLDFMLPSSASIRKDIVEMLERLQADHDSNPVPRDMKGCMGSTAKYFGVSSKALHPNLR